MDDETIHRYRWWALAVLSFSLLVIGIDNTILNVALPQLAESLGATNSQLQWIVDGYTLVYAGLILTAGSLGDRYGRKGALTIGLVVFGLGSVASAFADSATALIATRSFMGIGGALIMPATLSILTNVFHDPTERARAIGVWAGVSAGGIAFGPIIGGMLITHYWWGAVFLVNVPVVLIALIAGHKVLPTSKDPSQPRLDPLGAILSIAALVVLLWGLIEAPTKGWTSGTILGAFALGLVLLALFIAWELFTDHPMLEVRFFANARFSAANAGITLVFFALFGSSFLITQQLQFVLGYSALKAGIAMMPIAIPLLILGPTSARIVERLGSKIVVTAGLALASLGLFWLSTISYGDGYTHVLFPMIVLACGMGLTMAPATESIMGSIPRSKAGIGSAMNDTTRQVGGALGVAVIGSVLASVYRPSVSENLSTTALGRLAAGTGSMAEQARVGVDAIRDQLGAVYAVAERMPGGREGPAGQELIHAARHAFVDGFGGAVLVGAVVALIGAAVVFAFLPARGTEVDHGDEPEPSGAHGAADDGDGGGEEGRAGDHRGDASGDGTEEPVVHDLVAAAVAADGMAEALVLDGPADGDPVMSDPAIGDPAGGGRTEDGPAEPGDVVDAVLDATPRSP